MSIKYYFDLVSKAEKEVADIQKKISEENNKELNKLKQINLIKKSISKYTTPSTLANKQRQINTYNSDILSIKKKAADLSSKLISKNKELILKKQNLNKEQERENKKSQREQADIQRKMKANLNAQINHVPNIEIQLSEESETNYLVNGNQIIENKIIQMKELFITYSWDNQEHENRVVAFTNYLRRNGYNAEIDKMLIQKQSAIDFSKMMHQAMTDYKKVLIVLSTGYKQKAEAFSGGVGNEYNLIIKDINENPNKYILISFEGITDDIVPLGLKGREIIDLSKQQNSQNLFHKLEEKPLYFFEEVASTKPELSTKQSEEFLFTNSKKEPFEIVKLINTYTSSWSKEESYYYVLNEFSIEIKNVSTTTITDFDIDIIFPAHLVDNSSDFTKDDENCIITHRNPCKFYPEKTIVTEKVLIKVTSNNFDEAINSIIKVVVYSEMGNVSKEFKLKDYFIVNNEYGQNIYLSDSQFI